jgi:MoaA/NifB/PqqE/SkfB family radical SAM enzyme
MKLHVVRERAWYAFKSLVLRRHDPWLAGLVITDKCNLNCHYCESKNKGLFDCSWGETCQALDSAHRRGCRSLYLTPGEPMLWRDVDILLLNHTRINKKRVTDLDKRKGKSCCFVRLQGILAIIAT